MSEPAPDPRPLAVPTKQVENDRFIVTEWRFAPGAHTGWHRHAFDYVVVPMTTGRLTLESAERTGGGGAGHRHTPMLARPASSTT